VFKKVIIKKRGHYSFDFRSHHFIFFRSNTFIDFRSKNSYANLEFSTKVPNTSVAK